MTTATFSVAGVNTNATTFRAWGLALSQALDTVGFPKTADTGQVDWATVAAPGAGNTKMGYEVRRFNDTLQATAPVIVRIDYGSGASATTPGLWFTIGKRSDGAGNITAVLLAALAANAGGSVASAVPSYVSTGDGSLLALSLWTTQTNMLTALVERSRSESGAATADGLLHASKNAVSSPQVYVYNYPSGALPAFNPVSAWPVTVPAAVGTGMAVGGLAPVFPAVVADGAGHYWQPRALVSYAPTDGGTGSPISVPGWGTYLPTGHAGWGTNNASVAAIAWS